MLTLGDNGSRFDERQHIVVISRERVEKLSHAHWPATEL
jgi:hypothetical protein